MSWPFLRIRRDWLKSDVNWGRMSMIDSRAEWSFLCFSYERPWREEGPGRSQTTVYETTQDRAYDRWGHVTRRVGTTLPGGRIELGVYELELKTEGDKGWRLELKMSKDTGHRTHIQIHRAVPSLYIEGCILPVHSRDVKLNSPEIMTQSLLLMARIKARYNELNAVNKKEGAPTVEISAEIPVLPELRSSAYA